MHCPECELAVETEWGRYRTQEDVERHVRPYIHEDTVVKEKHLSSIDEELTLDDVGEYVEIPNGDGSTTDWHVSVRTDTCANCTAMLNVRTFCEHWDMSNKKGSDDG